MEHFPAAAHVASARRTRKRLAAGFCLLLSAAAAVVLGLKLNSHATRHDSVARVGKPLPPLVVVDESGRSVDISKVALGKKTVIVFFSPSCQLCQTGLPELQPFPSGLYLIMVNEGDSGSSEEFERFATEHGAMFLDRHGVFSRSFPMTGVPAILFVDERGVLRDAQVGARGRAVMQQKLHRLLQRE